MSLFLAISYWPLAISYFHNIFCCQNGGFTTLGKKNWRRIVSRHTDQPIILGSGRKYAIFTTNILLSEYSSYGSS
jgi:hypothetical protein